MAASSEESVNQLTEWRTHLDTLVGEDPDAEVPPKEQAAIERSIAIGIAVLAGEPAPADASQEAVRPILARDLRITTDVVLRALEAHKPGGA